MATSVIAEAAVKIKPDTTGFKEQTTSSIGGTVAKIGGLIGGLAIGSKIFSAVKDDVIGFNSTLEQSRVAFTNLLGSGKAADTMLANLQQFAKATPFSFEQLIPISQQLVGALGKSADIVPIMTRLGDAVSATGGSGDKLQQLTLAYTQMATSGKANLGDLNQINTAVPGSIARMADAAGLSVGQFRQKITNGMLSSGQAIKLFNKVTTDPKYGIAGGMAAQSKTFAGAMSNIGDAIQQGLAKAGAPIFGFVSEVAKGFANFLSDWQNLGLEEAIVKAFGGQAIPVMKAFMDAFSTLKNVAVTAFGLMQAALKMILPPLEEFIGFIVDHIDIFGPLAIGIGIAAAALLIMAGAMVVATGAATALGAALAVAFSPVVIIVVAVGLLIGALILLYKHNEAFRQIVDQAWSGVKETITTTITVLRAIISGFVDAATTFWHTFGGTITSVVKIAFNTLEGVVKGGLKIVQGVFNVIGGLIHGNWSQVWQGIKQIVSGALGIIVSLLKGYIGIYSAIGRLLINGLTNAFQDGISLLVTAAKGIGGKVKDALSGAGWLLYNAGKAIIQGLINGIGSMVSSLASKMHSVVSTITDHLPNSPQARVGPLSAHPPEVMGARIVKGLVEGMQSQASMLAGTMGQLTGSMAPGLGGAGGGTGVVINGDVHFSTTADSFAALQKDALNKQALRVRR